MWVGELLVTNEPIEVQDIKRIANLLRRIYVIYLDSLKKENKSKYDNMQLVGLGILWDFD